MRKITGIMLTEQEHCRLKQKRKHDFDNLRAIINSEDLDNSKDNFELVNSLVPYETNSELQPYDEYLKQSYPTYNKEHFLLFIKDIIDYVQEHLKYEHFGGVTDIDTTRDFKSNKEITLIEV